MYPKKINYISKEKEDRDFKKQKVSKAISKKEIRLSLQFLMHSKIF